MSEAKAKIVFNKIFGEAKAEEITEFLETLSPRLGKIGITHPFGEFYVHEDRLDLRTRELVTISTLVTQGTLPQLKIHIHGALNVGCTREEIEETILQLSVYVGMPKTINALVVMREAFDTLASS